MKKHTNSILIAGLALVALLLCGTGLAKTEPDNNLANHIKAELAHIKVEALLDTYTELTKRIKGDGEEAQAKHHQLEECAAEVKAHIGELGSSSGNSNTPSMTSSSVRGDENKVRERED